MMTSSTISPVLGFLGQVNDWLRGVFLKPGNSNLSASVDGLFMFILWVCIISFVIMMGLMVYFVFKYRRRPGVPQQRSTNHNTALEVSWIVLPLIVVTLIFFWGFHGYMAATVSPANAELINVRAFRWSWEITYPNGAGTTDLVYLDDDGPLQSADGVPPPVGATRRRGNAEVPVIAVPEGRAVKFVMNSSDVLHSFYIPDMRIKMDVIPNRYTSLTFVPLSSDGPSGIGKVTQKGGASEVWEDRFDKDGKPLKRRYRDHYIFCAEYCGDAHSEMAAILRVMPEADYADTIRQWGNIADKVEPWKWGEIIHKTRCAACHSIDGSAGTGPSWKGFYGKKPPLSADGGIPIDWAKDMDLAWANYIRESILDPTAKVHEGYPAAGMQSFAGLLNDSRDIPAVIAYMRRLNLGEEAAKQKFPADYKVPEKKKPEAPPAGAAPAPAPTP